MEFFTQIRHYILVFIFFGLWSSMHDFKYKLSLRIYSIFLLLLMFCFFLLTVYFRQFYTFTTITNTVANSLFVLVVITHFIIIVESIWQRKVQKRLIKEFIIVDEIFKTKLNIRIPYQKEKRKMFIIFSTVLLIVLPIEVAVTVYLFYNSHVYYIVFQSVYSMWIIRLRPMQVLFFVFLLRTRLNLMNEKLKMVANIIKVKEGGVRNRLNRGVATISGNSSSTLPIFDILLELKQVYTELYNINESINTAFGYSLLAIMTQNFVDFTSNCYWVYLTAQSFEKLITFASLLVPNLTVLGILTFCCSSCHQEVYLDISRRRQHPK